MPRNITDTGFPKLRETDRWTWRQRRFIKWCALPKEKRPDGLETQRKIGEFLGVGPSTLGAWKTYPGFWKEVYREAKICIGDVMPEILRSMAREAIAGSVSAAKLCLECLGLYSDEGQAPIQFKDPLIFVMNRQGLPPPRTQQIAGGDRGEEEPVEGEFEVMELIGAASVKNRAEQDAN